MSCKIITGENGRWPMPRIAAVMVGTDEERFRCVDANDERMALARRIAAFTQGDGQADIVLLPAGFLAVDDEGEIKPTAKALASIFKKQVLLAGIDEEDGESNGTKGSRRSGKSGKVADSSEGYHYWAFASDAGKIVGGPWWQRSAYSGEDTSDTSPRCVTTANASIGLLICGEVYNPALANTLAQVQPDFIVDLAHISMKRFTKSLHRVAKTSRRSVFHVQHVALSGWAASKWMATSRGARRDRAVDWASYDKPGWTNGALWAEVKIWES
jgi:predicted amidohydrolase